MSDSVDVILRVAVVLFLAQGVVSTAHAGALEAARTMEQALSKDDAKLKYRHNIERLVRAWQRAGKSSDATVQRAALEGEARAWKLMAHWSGRNDDRARAKKLAAELAQTSKPAATEPRSKPKDAPDQKKAKPKAQASVSEKPKAARASESRDAKTQAKTARLKKLIVEVSDDQFEVLLDIDGEKIRVRRRQRGGAKAYFDLSPLVAERAALGRLAVDHAGVHRIRVGQFDPTTVRIVFDFDAKRLPGAIQLSSDGRRFSVESSEPPRAKSIAKAPVEPSPVTASEASAAIAAAALELSSSSPKNSKRTSSESRPDPTPVSRVAPAPPVDAHDHEHGEDASIERLLDQRFSTKSAVVTGEDLEAEKASLDKLLDRIIPDDAPADPEPPADPESPTESEPPAAKSASKLPAPKPTKLARSTRRALAPRPSLVEIRRVVVDAGHGGKDAGAVGKTGLKEKDVNLAIALQLGKELEKSGIKVIFTRKTDRFISLRRRAQIANRSDADLFISVHANANRNRKIRGIETYYLNTTSSRYSNKLARRENAWRHHEDLVNEVDPDSDEEETDDFLPPGRMGQDLKLILADLAMQSAAGESRRLAAYIQRDTVRRLRGNYDEVKDLGVKRALFYVLLGVRMPSVLVESGFVTNRYEEKRLSSRRYRKALARSIAAGVQRYIQERNEIAARGPLPGELSP